MIRFAASCRLFSCSAALRFSDSVMVTTTIPCVEIDRIAPVQDFSEIIDVREGGGEYILRHN
jgi:hypothetical protein